MGEAGHGRSGKEATHAGWAAGSAAQCRTHVRRQEEAHSKRKSSDSTESSRIPFSSACTSLALAISCSAVKGKLVTGAGVPGRVAGETTGSAAVVAVSVCTQRHSGGRQPSSQSVIKQGMYSPVAGTQWTNSGSRGM